MQRLALISIILALTLAALFGGIGKIGLRAEEPRRAVVSFEMMETDQYVVPQIYGEPYFNKPPLFNWVQIAVFRITGSAGESAARLPGVLSVIGIALLIFFTSRSLWGFEMGLFSALIFITGAELMFYGLVNAGEIDLFFSLLVFVQIMSFWWFRHDWWKMMVVTYLFCALGVLTKGAPSLVFQVFSLMVAAKICGRWKLLVSWQHGLGLLVFLAMVVPYFYAFHQQQDLSGYLINLFKESSQRSANEQGLLGIVVQLAAFPFQVVSVMAPWSLIALFMFSKKLRSRVEQHPLAVFVLLALLANIWIYAISPGLKNRYLYVFFPFMSLLLSYVLFQARLSDHRLFRTVLLVLGSFISIFFLALTWIPKIGTASNPLVSIAIGVVVAGLVFFMYAKPAQILYWFVMVLLIGKIGFDQSLLPHFDQVANTTYFKSTAQKMKVAADGVDVQLTGPGYSLKPDVSFIGAQLAEEELWQPPLFSFHFYYYYILATNRPIHYSDRVEPGGIYLCVADRCSEIEKTVLLEFFDHWIQKNMIVFKANQAHQF